MTNRDDMEAIARRRIEGGWQLGEPDLADSRAFRRETRGFTMIRGASPRRCLAWIAAAAALVSLGCAEPPPQPPEAAPAAEIDRTLAEWSEAFERGDAAALVALVSEDAEFWTHGAPPVVGRQQLEDAFVAFFAEYTAVQRFEVVERTVAGNLAILRGEEVNTLTPKTGGESFDYRQRAFSMLRREDDGRWRFWRGMTNQGPAAPVEPTG